MKNGRHLVKVSSVSGSKIYFNRTIYPLPL